MNNNDVQSPDVILFHKDSKGVAILSKEVWYKRIWLLITNPLRYILTGKTLY